MDRAVATFGNALQNELDSVEGKTNKAIERKRQRIIERWIPEAREEKKFRDPASG